MKKLFLLFALAILFTLWTAAAENIVFTFNSEDDIKANITSASGFKWEIEDGYTKIVNTDDDPHFDLPVAGKGIDCGEYKYMKIRMKCADITDGNFMYQVFCQTDESGAMGNEGTWINNTFLSDGDFAEIEIDLTAMGAYKGKLERLRIDPCVIADKTTIYLDYIALFDNKYKMEKYPEAVSDEEIEEKERAEEEANRPKVSNTSPDMIIYPFRTSEDYEAFVDYAYAVHRSYEGVNLVLTNYSNNSDPHITNELDTEEERFYADDLPFIKIRFQPLNNGGAQNLGQVFFTTEKHKMGEIGTYKNFPYIENGEWQEIIIDLKNDIEGSLWSDIVLEVRYDHSTSNETAPVKLEYIGLFPTREAAEAFSMPAWLPEEGHDTVEIGVAFGKIILPAGTVRASDTINDYSIMQSTAPNPDKVVGGAVVQYTDGEGNSSIVALSDENTRNVYYVADKPGKYSLTYNTKKYDDIAGHWGYATIMYSTNRNLFGGTSPNEFSPDMPMTRGMFITVLGRMQGVDTSLYADKTVFGDVNPNEYYAPYINWAAEKGIVEKGEGFMPESPVSRRDMATYICNYINAYNYVFPESDSVTEFSDISALPETVRGAIMQVQSVGILNGKGDGIFDPDGISTRAEVATVMSRLIKSILGLKLDFFATSEQSMEFKPLEKDRLRFGAYVPHPQDITVLDENHIRTIAEAGIDFTVLNDWLRGHILDKMGYWYERYGIEYVYHSTKDAIKLATDGVTRTFDKEKASDLDDFQDEIPYAGLSIVDEPGLAMFPQIGQSVKDFYELYPDKMAFINLLPLYANQAQLTEGAWAAEIEYYEGEPANYKRYLEEYIKEVPTPYICVDVYPCYANKKTYGEYAKAIEFVADACRESGREFWIFNQCCFWGTQQYVIDETDIYWQGYTVMSFGAKTILYYILSALRGHYDTPIDEVGDTNATYDAMQKFHNEIRRFDEIYLSYNNVGAFNRNAEKAPWVQLNNPYTEFDTITDLNCSQPLLVGCFEAKEGSSTAFTLVNHSDRSAPKADTITFKVNGTVVTAYIDGYATQLTPDSNGYYTVNLECGRGVFVTVA